MPVLDYARSYVTFVTRGRTNQARIQVEARCQMTWPDGRAEETWLVASCKAENTYAERNLFQQPNYDFAMLYTRERYRICRIGAEHGSAPAESGLIAERFESARFDLSWAEGAEWLKDDQSVLAATLAGRPLVAQNRLVHTSGATALLEYPVKTMNINTELRCWQVDTGPLIVPTEPAWAGDLDGFDVAFAAFRTTAWTEYIARAPLSVGDGAATIDHFHEVSVATAGNSLWALI